MGTRVEQSGEFVPRASGTSRRHLEDLADSLYRLPSAAEDLQIIIPCRNRALLLQGEFCITRQATISSGNSRLFCYDSAMDEHVGPPVQRSHANGEQLAQELQGIQQENNPEAARRWRARGNITGREVARAFGRAMYSIYVDRRSGNEERAKKPLDVRLIDRFVAKRLAKSTEAAPVSPDEEAEVLAEFDAVYQEAWRWHGTGRKQHRGGQTVDILREISGEGGLRPHEDVMDPIVGEMDSVSTSASRMYARPYADMHQDRTEPMSYRYGKASYWAQFFVSPIALEGLIELKAWRKGPARDRAQRSAARD